MCPRLGRDRNDAQISSVTMNDFINMQRVSSLLYKAVFDFTYPLTVKLFRRMTNLAAKQETFKSLQIRRKSQILQ